MKPLGYAEPSDPRYVYTFWNADGVALYVGCTSDFARRLRSHTSERPWFGEVVRMDISVHADEQSGLMVEAARIRLLDPVHNSVYTSHATPKRLPCSSCHTGRHRGCRGENRDGDPCRCSVCARDKASA